MITRKLVVTMTALALFISLCASDIFAGGWGDNHKWGRHGMHGKGGHRQYKIRRGHVRPGGQVTKIHAVDCPQGIKVYSNNNGQLTPATGASIVAALQSSGSFEFEGTCTDSGGPAMAAAAPTPVPAGAPASDGSDGSSDGSSTAATSTASSYDYDNE